MSNVSLEALNCAVSQTKLTHTSEEVLQETAVVNSTTSGAGDVLPPSVWCSLHCGW